MIKSMTGYGRGENLVDDKTFIVEIKTVNHKYNDVSIRMPKILNALENKIRSYINDYLKRGKVDVFITYKNLGMDNKNIVLDEQLANSYVEIMEKLKSICEIEDRISLSLISRFPDVVTVETEEEDKDELWNMLEIALKNSLESIVEMREQEGENLKKDIIYRLGIIEDIVKQIQERSPIVIEEYREKLRNRISELVEEENIDEQRLAMEIAIMSDKSNITEEIIRLYSHLKQMGDTLNQTDSIGKKLNFIVQEMNREANTINSKVNDLEIINNILLVKSEIEKIREQIQNIE